MSSDETKRTTTALRVKVRYPDVDTFVERFAVNVGRSGLFIPTPAPKPVGSEVRFEVRLADDRAVLIGQGVVRWIREPMPGRSRATTGMAIELQRVSRDSRDVLVRMLQTRKRLGLVDGPGGLPAIDDEPRAADDGDEEEHRSSQRIRRLTIPPEPSSAPVPEGVPDSLSVAVPVTVPVVAPIPDAVTVPTAAAVSAPEPEPASEPEPEPEPEAVAAPEPAPLPEAPRLEGAVVLIPSEPVLDAVPEPVAQLESDGTIARLESGGTIPAPPPPGWTPRPRRQRLSERMPEPPPLPPPPEPAPAPLLGESELDIDGLDLDAIFERARAITALTSDLDADLAEESALDVAAVPESITADEASTRLAAMFGTAPPVRRTTSRAGSVPVAIPSIPIPAVPRPIPATPSTPAPLAAREEAVAALSLRAETERTDAGWDDDEGGRTPAPLPPPPEVLPPPPEVLPSLDGLPGIPLSALPELPRSTRAGTMPMVAIPRPPGPVTRTTPPGGAPVATATASLAPAIVAPASQSTSPPPAIAERRRLDLDLIERHEVERERAERERSERERAEAVRLARAELATIDPLSEPLELEHEQRISIAESLAPMDPSNIELAPAMGFLDDLELDDRRGRRASTMPLAPPRAQIPPAGPSRIRRGSTPPPPPRSTPAAANTGTSSAPRPAAFTGRHDDEITNAPAGPAASTTSPPPAVKELEAALEALDETTQVSGATLEVDLDVEQDVLIELDDAT